MKTLPKFKLNPAFKKSERAVGKLAEGVDHNLRANEITIRGVVIGSIWNPAYSEDSRRKYGVVGDYTNCPWRTTIFGDVENRELTYASPDLEHNKQAIRDHINVVWYRVADRLMDKINLS